MSMKRLNKEYCCSPSAKQYAHVLYELGISKEAIGETERLFEEVPVLEETFASPVVPMREKLSSIDKIFPEEIKNFLKVVCRNQRMSEISQILLLMTDTVKCRKESRWQRLPVWKHQMKSGLRKSENFFVRSTIRQM